MNPPPQNTSPAERLQQFAQQSTELNRPPLEDFANLLAPKVSEGLLPQGFLLNGMLLLGDLERGVVASDTTAEDTTPKKTALAGKSSEFYIGLRDQIPFLAGLAFSKEYEDVVRQGIEAAYGSKGPESESTAANSDITVESIEFEGLHGKRPLNIYFDESCAELTEMFDPLNYSDSIGSLYGNANTEETLGSFAQLAKKTGRYCGLDLEGLRAVVLKYTHSAYLHLEGKADQLPDLRVIELGGKKLYFPTEKLLEWIGAERLKGESIFARQYRNRHSRKAED